MAYRPLLVGTARTIVSSEPFRAGFRRAAQSAHAALFSAERRAPRPLGPRPRRARPQRARPRPHARRPHPREPARQRHASGRAGRGARALAAARCSSATGSAATRSWRSARASLLARCWASPCRATAGRALLHGGAALAAVALVLFFLPPLARTALTALDGERGAAAGGGRGVGRLHGRAPPVGARPRRRSASSSPSAASSFASHVEVEEVGAARLDAAAEAGPDLAGRDPPGRRSSPGSASSPRSARPRPCRA